MNRRSLTALIPALLLALPALAFAADDWTAAEVRKVDKAAAKLTLKHGEIATLGMPPMTMVFELRDKTAVDRVKVGDKVKFRAATEGGKFYVTEIEVQR